MTSSVGQTTVQISQSHNIHRLITLSIYVFPSKQPPRLSVSRSRLKYNHFELSQFTKKINHASSNIFNT